MRAVSPILCSLALLALSATSRAATPAAPLPESACSEVGLAADTMVCENERCVLDGAVRIECTGLTLFADRVTVTADERRAFRGALAEGNVLVLQGTTAMSCSRMTLGEDRVRGRIDDAVVRIKATPPLVPSDVRATRDRAVFRGDIERITESDYRVDDAEFTLCDCGDEPPSWRLVGRRLEATLGERATMVWPVMWIRPFGLFDMPITPPLPPISVPFKRRAMGMLAPAIQLYRAPWPTVDVPVFVPLGRSWDLTLQPGLRMDWGEHDWGDGSTYGAPRLGVRVRGAPAEGTVGTLTADWTHDPEHFAARWREIDAARAADLSDPEAFSRTTPDWKLAERVSLSWTQRAALARKVELALDAQWVSDDLVLQDSRLNPAEQAATYLVSRAGVTGRLPGAALQIGADYFQQIGANGPVLDYSNVRGAENATLHRMPVVSAVVLPLTVAPGAHLDASMTLARFGTLTDAVPHFANGAPGLTHQLDAHGTVGVSLARSLGPVATQARATLDGVWARESTGRETASLATVLDAEATLRLARTFGAWTHRVTPRLALRSIPSVDATRPSEPRWFVAWDRRELHQALIEVGQTLWRDGELDAPGLDLRLAQPVDLESHELLDTRIALAVGPLARSQLSAWLDLVPGEEDAVRELGVRASSTLGILSLAATYARWTPSAERLTRSAFELSAPRVSSVSDAGWMHAASGSATLKPTHQIALTYAGDYLLPTPLEPERSEFFQQTVSAAYSSSCGECWGLSTALVLPTPPPGAPRQWRLTFNFTLGGFSVGG